MLIGYARVSTQETREQSPEKRRRTPLTTFWAAETQLGEPPHCVRSRLRRMQAPQRSSETPRLACKIAPICLIPYVAIHVTTAPGEAVIERCRTNLNDGYKPVLVTIRSGIAVAEGLANNKGLAERIDVFEIEQFVALNLYELGEFAADGRRVAVDGLVRRYNEIVEEVETDPSLKIKIRG